MNKARCTMGILVALGFLLAGEMAFAQSYPAKPVRIIVPWGAGGGTDIQARLLASHFHEWTGQPFVVENRAGASGLIGAEIAARSRPDGYTILFSTATLTINKTLYGSRMKIDPVKDLAPISWIASTPLVLVVHPSVPANSVKQLVSLAKRKPGLLFASATNSFTDFAGTLGCTTSTSGVDAIQLIGARSFTGSIFIRLP